MITLKAPIMQPVTSPPFGPALQLRIERRLCSSSWLLLSVVTILRKRPHLLHLLEPRRQPSLHLRGCVGRRAFCFVLQGQEGRGEDLKSSFKSFSDTSDSQDFVRSAKSRLRWLGPAAPFPRPAAPFPPLRHAVQKTFVEHLQSKEGTKIIHILEN